MQKKTFRMYEKEVKRCGCRLVAVVRRKGHPKLVIEHAGRTRKVVVASTPSDIRTKKNVLAQIRRTCRELAA